MGKEDILLKSYLGDARRYADLWNGALFGGRQLVRPEELEEASPVLLKERETFLEKRRDLVMKQSREGQRFAVLVAENQKTVDYSMPIRVMLEEALAYYGQVKSIRKENEEADRKCREKKSGKVYADAGERLYMFRKEDKLKPIATLVVYWGEGEWTGARSLHDIVDFGGEKDTFSGQLKKLVPEYPLHFLDLNTFCHFEYFKTELGSFLELYQKRNDKEEFRKYVEAHKKSWKMDRESLYVFSHMTNSRNLKELMKKEEKKEEENKMCKAIDGWIEDVKKEGKAEGKTESILTLLEDFGEISDDLQKRIKAQKDASVLKNWLKLAARAKSIEDFSSHMDIAYSVSHQAAIY